MNGQFYFMRRYLILSVILLLVGCGSHEQQRLGEPRVVKCAIAAAVDSVRRDFAALSTADDAVNLAFKISGRVVDIPVAKGVVVRKGEFLAELDRRDVELQVDAARAAYREAQSRLERAKRLFEHSAISAQEVESLENSLAQAESLYANSLDLLADTRIVAPFDGIVERTYVDVFQRVSSGETILRIVTPISHTVGFTAPESIVTQLGLQSTRFSVLFDAWPDTPFRAVIKSFARTSSDALGFPVSLRLVDVDSQLYNITPGMTCIATVITPESDRDAVLVPLTAIYAPVEGGEYVWVVGDDDRVEKNRVVLGPPTDNDDVVVLEGLSVGERVVIAGVYHLTEGESVKILKR